MLDPRQQFQTLVEDRWRLEPRSRLGSPAQCPIEFLEQGGTETARDGRPWQGEQFVHLLDAGGTEPFELCPVMNQQ